MRVRTQTGLAEGEAQFRQVHDLVRPADRGLEEDRRADAALDVAEQARRACLPRVRRRQVGVPRPRVGLLVGVGVYTCVYVGSYLTDKPAACVNCHVMQSQYAGWIKGAHRSVAVCNDCHTPDGVIGNARPRRCTASCSLCFYDRPLPR